MEFLFTPEFWARWLSIVVIDLTLAGDNALVIAMAVRTLPPRQQLYGRLGGTFGAVTLRLVFIAIISQLLRIPLLQAAGGLLLIWIAIKLVRQQGPTHSKVRQGATFWEAIWIIILADVIMSLDNVLAVAGAAHGDLWLVAFGIGLSIPIIIWGSGLLARLMNRFPPIVWGGGGVLGFVAGEMLIGDRIVHQWIAPWADILHRVVPLALALGLFTLAWWIARSTRAAGVAQPATEPA